MFARISTLFIITLLSFPFLAVATPWGSPTTPAPKPTTVTVTVSGPTVTAVAPSQCNAGDIQCCNSVQKGSSPSVGIILGLLGIVLQSVDVLVGLDCSSVTVGVGGNSGCSEQLVCCENNTFNGVIAIGCTPININL